MKHKEALDVRGVFSQPFQPVHRNLYLLLPNGVVAPGVVVGSVLLASDHAAGVEEVSVRTGPDLIDDGWLQVHEDSPGDVLASGRLGEEGVERVVSNPHRVVVRHGAV